MTIKQLIALLAVSLSQMIHAQNPKRYVFEDHTIRQIAVYLINDSLIKVKNDENARKWERPFSIFYFTDEYKCIWIDKKHAILKLITTDRKDLKKRGKAIFPVSLTKPNKVKNSHQIFPILDNDTIVISRDSSMMFIKPFILRQRQSKNWLTETNKVSPLIFARTGICDYTRKFRYSYCDRKDRNLSFSFIDSNTVEISNVNLDNNDESSINCCFKDVYEIEFCKSVCRYKIKKLISTTRKDRKKGKLFPPLSTDSIHYISNIFPILENMTIHFSLDYCLLQIGPFTFNYEGEMITLGDAGLMPPGSEVTVEPVTLMTLEYSGGHVYRNGRLERVGNPYGYWADSTFHYHITDHLGNIRAVIAEDGTLEEINNYYPYGGLMGAAGTGVQFHKYGAKELDRENGLDLYDSHARWYDPLLARTTTQDPLAEKYRHLSPYAWCAGNPIKLIDRDGKDYGDTLATQDAAAIDFGICYNGKSIIKNREYVTNIYSFKTPNGMTAYSYTIPQRGTSTAGADPVEPANAHPIVARAHTHAAFLMGFNNNKFSGETNSAEGNKHSSEGDVFLYNLKEVDGYVATPNGSLRKYDYKTGEVVIICDQMPSDKNDPKRLNNISPVLSISATYLNLKFEF